MPTMSTMSTRLRFWYALTKGYDCRACLRKYISVSEFRADSVTQLNFLQLTQLGVQELVLDFDGVLAPHGALLPLPEVVNWLKALGERFGFEKITIFSNKPLSERRHFFTVHFPAIKFLTGVPKKPYPDGLVQIQKSTGIALEKILLVDDRLLTGMLAVCISGVQGIYITQPYKNFKANPVREAFFELLRKCERWVLK